MKGWSPCSRSRQTNEQQKRHLLHRLFMRILRPRGCLRNQPLSCVSAERRRAEPARVCDDERGCACLWCVVWSDLSASPRTCRHVEALKYGRGAARPVVTAGFARTTRITISITKSYLPLRLCNAHDKTDFLFSRPVCHVDLVGGGGAVWVGQKFENRNNMDSSMTAGVYRLATAC